MIHQTFIKDSDIIIINEREGGIIKLFLLHFPQLIINEIFFSGHLVFNMTELVALIAIHTNT